MAQSQVMSQYRNNSISAIANQELNQEFFDLSPRPWDVDVIELIDDTLRIFIDWNNPETFLIEIKFQHWTKAKYKHAVISRQFEYSNVDVYRIGKSLFIRKLLF